MATAKPDPEKPAAALPAVPASTANGFPISSRPDSLGWSFTTLDRTTPLHRALATRAADMDGATVESMIGKRIEVEHIYLMPRELLNPDTGECFLKMSICLIDPAGTMYNCLSTGAYNSLRALWQEQGPGPWADPLVIEVAQLPLPEGKRTFKLRFLGRRSELADAGKVKK